MDLSNIFTRETLLEYLAQSTVTNTDLQILRWLIWLPLLSGPELARLMQRDEKTIAASLGELEEQKLIIHLAFSEPEVSHHFRYHVSNLGLYVFASLATPPLSVPRLVQAYAVDRDDLLARLVRPDLLATLADISTRLAAEGRAISYPLVSYQQPWSQTDTIFGRRQTLHFDAALLIRHPQGTEHACYVHIDSVEGRLFREPRERLRLGRLLSLREALRLQREHAPRLLIVTHPSRLMLWAEVLASVSEGRATALIEGGITLLERIHQDGIHAPIWWSLNTLHQWAEQHQPQQPLPASSVALVDLLGPPTSRALAERFSQRESFGHLLTERNSGPLRQSNKPLPDYVGSSLKAQAEALHKHVLADALTGTKAEQREAAALLTLHLSEKEKELMALLTHHPLLTIHNLAALLVPSSSNIRVVQRLMPPLDALGLLLPFNWWKADGWKHRERYLLSETALRYMAMRDGLPPTTYLLPQKYKKNEGPLSIQRWSGGLFAQMLHTSGLYDCMGQLNILAHRNQVRILLWKNEGEAMRWCRHPFKDDPLQIRPDAEVLYLLPGEDIPRSVLLEYDRATTGLRELEGKFSAYADFQEQIRVPLPPIAVITQNAQSVHRIQSVLQALAAPSHVEIFLETTLGTSAFFRALGEPS